MGASPRAGASGPLTDREVELLRGLAREPVEGRRGPATAELEALVARGLAASTFVGHAGIHLRITDAGTRALAELDAPPPSSVYEVADVREELAAFLDAWRPVVGDERLPRFKANLAFLIDLAVVRGLALERMQLRRKVAEVTPPSNDQDQVLGTVLALLDQPSKSPIRGRSSRPRGAGA